MTVQILKLLTGEELIGKIVEQDHLDITIDSPANIHMAPTQDSRMQLYLIPYAPYAEKDVFTLKQEHVIMQYDPNVDLLNKYNSMFGSGIQLATSGGLLK
jgi:F0F1-type ATP synthase alpha subunit